jgi:hypothetical protein
VDLGGEREKFVTTRYERAKTQAKIELVLADIRRLEARGLGWVGTPAAIARAIPPAGDRRPISVGLGLVVRAKAGDRPPRALANKTTVAFPHRAGGVAGHRAIRAV